MSSALALTSLTANAVNSTLQPINTRFAQTQDAFSIEAGASTFSDIEMEEANKFDGWTSAVEIVAPLKFLSDFTKNMQVRLFFPTYTDGTAKTSDPALPEPVGTHIDIDGNGGLYDFMTGQFEHQIFHYDEDGFNGAYTIGWGKVYNSLDTTTSDKDLYNHSGKVFLAGLKFDRPISLFGNDSQLLLNGGIRSYYDTDDLIPEDKDDFTWADLRGAVIFEKVGYFVPVLEMTYLGDFGSFSETLLKPELIIPFNEHASMKLGGIISLSNDGNQGGFAGSLSYGF
jgi:hypothetical protein